MVVRVFRQRPASIGIRQRQGSAPRFHLDLPDCIRRDGQHRDAAVGCFTGSLFGFPVGCRQHGQSDARQHHKAQQQQQNGGFRFLFRVLHLLCPLTCGGAAGPQRHLPPAPQRAE